MSRSFYEQIKYYLSTLTRRDLIEMFGVFLVYFFAAKFSLYVYFAYQTSPALIWPPVGIGLAAFILRGYRMTIPIFLAQLFVLILYSPFPHTISLIVSAGFVLQDAVSLYFLRRLNFELSFDKLRNTPVLMGVALSATIIEPVIATYALLFLHKLPNGILLNIGRAWGGGLFSVIVFTTFILMWFRDNVWHKMSRKTTIELILATLLLLGTNYFLFWTPYPQYFGISVIFFLPLVLIWFGLRFEPKWMTYAILLTSIQGIIGTILAHPSIDRVPLNQQLFTDEVYIGLVAAIFLVFVAVVEDRRAAHRRLEKAYRSTATADKAKSDFIAILAHELRNPLAPIVSSLELLSLQPLSSESHEIIEQAQDNVKMMRRLLDDLLDTARLSQKKFALQKETVRLRDLIEQSVSSVKEMVDSHGHTLKVKYLSDDIYVYVDPIRIKQVLINLLNNACKYTKYGGLITLTCERSGSDLTINITDTGLGILPHMLENIFEPFEQIDTPVRGAGLGIGLFLAKRLVEMHDGSIAAESRGADQGSRFTVRIPLLDQAILPVKRSAATGHISGGKRKILIVDDNEVAADVMQKLLQHGGHNVRIAYSGAAALEVVDEFKPEYILLDIGMPDMDGHEVARKLRAGGWGGTLIALTGYGQDSDREQTKLSGFDHHLVKPISVNAVTSIILASSTPSLERAEGFHPKGNV